MANGQGGAIPDWAAMAKSDPNIQQLEEAGVPMTRENYLDAAFDGNVPQEWNEEAEMGLPPELQNFAGVGLSELPQGPLPIPEGRMGGGPPPDLEKGQAPPAVEGPQHALQSPLRSTPISGGQFKQSVGVKPQTPQGGQGG